MERIYKILATFSILIGCIEASWSLSFHLFQYPPTGEGEPRNCGDLEIEPTERNAYDVLQKAAKKNCETPSVVKFIHASRCKNKFGEMNYIDIASIDKDKDSTLINLKPDSKGNINLYIVQ